MQMHRFLAECHAFKQNRARIAPRPAFGKSRQPSLVGQAGTDDIAGTIFVILRQTAFCAVIIVFRLVGEVLAFDIDLEVVVDVVFG